MPTSRSPVPIRVFLAAAALGASALEACAGSRPGTSESASETTDTAGAEGAHGTAADEAAAAATCRAQNGDPGCRWSIQQVGYCSGAALVEMPPPRLECVCNECLQDDHCRARASGQCRFSNQPFACSPSQGHCVYPGDACYGVETPCPPSMGMPP